MMLALYFSNIDHDNRASFFSSEKTEEKKKVCHTTLSRKLALTFKGFNWLRVVGGRQITQLMAISEALAVCVCCVLLQMVQLSWHFAFPLTQKV